MKICIVRELCEELGLTINKNEVVSVDSKIRTSIIEDKENWLNEVISGNIEFDPSSLTLIRERITLFSLPYGFIIDFFIYTFRKIPQILI